MMSVTKQRSLESIYQNVPRKYVEELEEFRAKHLVQRQKIDGIEWHYIDCGEGDATVLILGGLMNTAETSRSLVESLEKIYRVITPAYPIYASLERFIDGLVKLLGVVNIPRVHVFGQSLGAGIGHALIRRYPDRVGKLVLSSFGLYNEQNLRRTKQFIQLFRFLPYGFVSGYYKRRIPRLLTNIEEGEKLFYAAYMSDVLDLQLDKKTLMSQFKLLEDMFENPGIYRVYEPVMDRNVLILQAKDDTGFNEDEQQALRKSYPRAAVHLFEEGGHLTRSTHRSEYDAILHEFLGSEPQHDLT